MIALHDARPVFVPCPRRDRRTHTLQAGRGDEESARSRRTDAGVDVRARRSARVLQGREQRRVLQTTGSIPCAEHRRRRALTFIAANARSEEHTSELQSLMRISYAVLRLK